MDDPGGTLATLFLILLMIVPVAILAALVQRQTEEREKEWKDEEERKARVRALYPERPSYEERTGVHYGPQEDDDETLPR